MATKITSLIPAGIKAGADLSSSQYLAVKFDSSEDVVLAGAGETAIGILQNKPADEKPADVAVGGGAIAIAGAAITGGAFLKANAAGKLIPVASNNDFYIARALEDGATNDHISVLVQSGYYGA